MFKVLNLPVGYDQNAGVYGTSTADPGVVDTSTMNAGVVGYSANGIASTPSTVGAEYFKGASPSWQIDSLGCEGGGSAIPGRFAPPPLLLAELRFLVRGFRQCTA